MCHWQPVLSLYNMHWIRQDFHSYGVFIYEFYQFKECLGVFFLITLNTPYYILYL